ncbi:MAG: hypothetical protein HFK09_00465 [Clostridia bacterium]|nr:hypothetical protein [Clostridia bacterium]
MRLTVIRTGGTIGCAKGADGVITLDENSSVVHFAGFDVKTVTPFYELSERLGIEHYDALLRCVLEEKGDADAMIITHGSDTLPYTASILAFALGKVDIPVVFVCSDKPLSDPMASGHQSLFSAAAFVKTGEGGVYVADGRDIHFAVRLLEERAYEEGFFSAYDSVCARVVGLKVKFAEHIEQSGEFPPLERLEAKRILYMKPYPDIDYASFDVSGYDCVLHDSYHSGTADERKLNEFAEKCGCPLYLVGGSNGRVYSSKAGFSSQVDFIDNITQPAMYAKLVVGLNRGLKGKELDDYLKNNLCGEIFA